MIMLQIQKEENKNHESSQDAVIEDEISHLDSTANAARTFCWTLSDVKYIPKNDNIFRKMTIKKIV
jgi:hypothetical protein